MSRAGIGRNFVAMMVWQVGNYLVPLLTFPYLTRVLGVSQFGVLGFATAIAAYGIALTEWGFNLSGPRATIECRDSQDALNRLVWTTMGAKACLGLLSFGAVLLILQFVEHGASIGTVVLLSWLTVLGNVITLNWLFQGLERFSLFATVSLIGRFLTLPLTFIWVKAADDVAIAAGIQAAASVLTGLLSLAVAWRIGVLKRPAASWQTMFERLRQSADMFVATASVSLFSATNSIMLGAMAGTYQVGIYSAADKIKTVGNMIPAQVNTVLYPRVSMLFADRARAAAHLTAIGALAILGTTAAGVAVISLLSGPLTRIVLGDGYHGCAAVLQVLGVATMFGNLAYFLGLQVFVPFGLERNRSRIMLVVGGLNVALAFLLIPRFGAVGAAVSFLVAEVAMLGVYAVAIVRTPRLRAHFLQLLAR
jgi:PST family polysaccharide transporter